MMIECFECCILSVKLNNVLFVVDTCIFTYYWLALLSILTEPDFFKKD